MDILVGQNLTKKYGKITALNDFNINVPEGSIYGLIGRNGAGKTTFMRTICGLQNLNAGHYIINGIDSKSKDITLVRNKMSAIIENVSLYADMTAQENLIVQSKILGLTNYNDSLKLLKLVNLENTTQKVEHYSLGMKQRLGIAMALVGNPKIILLDEPTNGLDPEGIIELRNLLLALNKEYGLTIIISSHYLDELSKIATTYGVVEKGKLIKEISKKDLIKSLNKCWLIKVNKPRIFAKYCQDNKIKYEKEKELFKIYQKINLTKLVVELDKNGCEVLDITKNVETLEDYFLKLTGGQNV